MNPRSDAPINRICWNASCALRLKHLYTWYRRLLVLFVCAAGTLSAFAQVSGPSKERIAAVSQMLAETPQGFGVPCSDRAAWERPSRLFEADVTQAERLIADPLPKWDDDAYLIFSRTGDRRAGERMLSLHTQQLTPLVLAECSEWKGRFLPRIVEQIEAIASERSWTLPAHDVKLENFNRTRYYVDLNAAQLAHTLAEALYLLGDRLPQETRQRAMSALELHVFHPMRRSLAGSDRDSWLDAKSNWNAVCLNGVTDAALTVLTDRNDRALFAASAVYWIENYLGSFTDSGYAEEGIGYWGYGFSNYEELREQLWLSTRGKIDIFDNPKARKVALFGMQFAMLPGVYADFGDAHFMDKPNPALLARIDRVLGLNNFADNLATIRKDRAALPLAVESAFPTPSVRAGGNPGVVELLGLRTYYDSPGVLVDRPPAEGRMAVTIKSGGNGGHSHNDIGSFSIGLGSTQIVGDPGGPAYYTAVTFTSQRYDSKLLNSFGHPVPVIDGKLQLEATSIHPKITATNFSVQQDAISIDMTPAYDVPHLQRFVRSLHYDRVGKESVQIDDDFQIAEPMDIEESLPTHGEVRQIDANTLQFDEAGEHMQMTVDAPEGFLLTVERIDEYGNAFIRAGLHFRLMNSGHIVMRFRETPQGK